MHHEDLLSFYRYDIWYNVQKCIQDKILVKYHKKPDILLLFDITPKCNHNNDNIT